MSVILLLLELLLSLFALVVVVVVGEGEGEEEGEEEGEGEEAGENDSFTGVLLSLLDLFVGEGVGGRFLLASLAFNELLGVAK